MEAELTRELRGSDPGPFNRIQRAFSVKGAFLETSQDSYRLQSLFPRLGRNLKRRISEETGAVRAVPCVVLPGISLFSCNVWLLALPPAPPPPTTCAAAFPPLPPPQPPLSHPPPTPSPPPPPLPRVQHPFTAAPASLHRLSTTASPPTHHRYTAASPPLSRHFNAIPPPQVAVLQSLWKQKPKAMWRAICEMKRKPQLKKILWQLNRL